MDTSRNQDETLLVEINTNQNTFTPQQQNHIVNGLIVEGQNNPNHYGPNGPNSYPQLNNPPNYQQGYNGPPPPPPPPPNQYYQNQPQQGYQPQGHYHPPPPPPPIVQTQTVVQLPSFITTNHPHYNVILQQMNLPCSACAFSGLDVVTMSPGCAAYAWSVCLYFFTGLLCFWIPFVCDGCKDIRISCSRCGRIKFVVEKPCC